MSTNSPPFSYRALRDKYCSSIPSDIRSWSIQGIQEDDDIPQLHFPSSEEGAGHLFLRNFNEFNIFVFW